jgi:hypothetical protein
LDYLSSSLAVAASSTSVLNTFRPGLDDCHDLGVPLAAPPASAYYRLHQP